jgi:3-oxoacyl-[acyl-carrier-protein] synthase-3
MASGSTIIGLGHHAPQRVVGNAELEKSLGLPDGWIFSRVGIRERRWAADGEALSDIAVKAGDMALREAGIDRNGIALTLLATSTPDHLLPPSAPLVAHRLGLSGSGAIDMAGACAGFLYALTLADAFVRVHRRPVLVVAANILSRRIDPKETASAVLFADAAGAALLAPCDREGAGVAGVELASDGSAYDLIKIPAGGSRRPFAPELTTADITMKLSEGPTVFAKAVEMMAASSRAAMRRAHLAVGDIDHWIPHQANSRIIAATRRQIGVPEAKLASTVAEFGNSSAATIPFTLSKALGCSALRPGTKLLLSAAGAGLTGGALVYRM